MWELLWNDAYITDTETLGLRPTGIHQLSLAPTQGNKIHEYWFAPHRVRAWSPFQDLAQISDFGHRRELFDLPSWQTALSEESAAKWVQDQLPKWTHLSGQTPQQRQAQLASLGLDATVTQTSVRGFFANEFIDAIAGKVLWIANAPFEASQVGSIMAGENDPTALAKFKAAFETQTSVPSQLYVTGAAVQDARARAQVSGDWTGVWRAYLNNPPPNGKAAVRDIQDVLRAMSSYGKQFNLLNTNDVYWGTQMETSVGIWNKILGQTTQVAHSTSEDVLAEKQVLRYSLESTWALQQQAENTALYPGLEAQAQLGEGPLYRARLYLTELEKQRPQLMAASLNQRVQRAAIDIRTRGATRITTDRTLIEQGRTILAGGVETQIASVDYNYRNITSLNDLALMLEHQGRYNTQDIQNTVGTYQKILQAGGDPSVVQIPSVQPAVGVAPPSGATNIPYVTPQTPSAAPPVSVVPTVPVKPLVVPRRALTRLGIAGGALAVVGAFLGSEPGEKKRSSLLSPTYYDYEEQRWDGMTHGGVAGATRSTYTDFGSPYQGPVVSNQVIADQDYARKREKWFYTKEGILKHGATDYNFWAPFFKALAPRQELISGGAQAGAYEGLRGDLQEIDVSNWVVSAEDADTVALRRGGFIAGMKNLIGLEPVYNIRIVGVDSPEVQHGEKQGQPWGVEATEIARNLLQADSLKLVYDPENSSYGRTVGTFIADGKNYSKELIKRGAAGFLPYDKPQYSMIDYSGLGKLEERAMSQNRGMWSQPYWSTIRAFDPDRQISFHSYVHEDRLAGSLYLHSAATTALAAQAGENPDISSIVQHGRMGFDYKNASTASKDGDSISRPMLSQVSRPMPSQFMAVNPKIKRPNPLSYPILDSTGETTSPYNPRALGSYDFYNSRADNSRLRAVQQAQLQALSLIKANPNQHHRMGQ